MPEAPRSQAGCERTAAAMTWVMGGAELESCMVFSGAYRAIDTKTRAAGRKPALECAS